MATEHNKKRRRTVSLNLENLLTSSENDSVIGKSDLMQYQKALAELDLKELLANDLDEEMILLCVVAKIGFLNAVLLKNCINQVPGAMLTHRRKYIITEFNRLSTKRIEKVEEYIDLMMSCCPNIVSETSKPKMQRYCRLFMYTLIPNLILYTYLDFWYHLPHHASVVPMH